MHRFKNFHFKGQDADEKIIKVIRRHWFNILQQYFFIIAITLFLFASFWIVPYFFDVTNASAYNLALFIQSSFATMIWVLIFIIWIDYYFDVWIITDKRVVNIEQKALFMRHVSELKFSKIQDVSIEVTGLIPTMLNYGDLHIQTAGKRERFLFHKVPDPYSLKSIIMNMQAKRLHRHPEEAHPTA
ncbi:PH domain-containing protein [Patescibacteria group bacterium]